MSLKIIRVALITALLVTYQAALSDDVVEAPSAESQRPKVGLVLGGGGARGAAHIGVLRELERLRVPVDAIAGTSMGAIVGGLYATGVTADDLEELVGSLDWAAALSDEPSRDKLSFRRKQDDREYPINFELGVRGTDLLLPKGLIQGQKLDQLLRELTLRASHISDFDDLPTPFRAIASDIVAGEPVVLGSGDLAQSIRASMSVPGVFAPAKIGGRYLVDGGLVGNLPVDVMRTMGVDIIIAVDVEFPLYGAEELGSVLTISEQMLTILIRKETLRQIETLDAEDILIRPDLGLYASANFDEILTAIEPGRSAAMAQEARLSELSLPEAEWNDYLAQRTLPAKQEEKLAFVRVQHGEMLSSKVIESRLSIKPGDDINARILADNANIVYGLQLYEHVGYKLVEENGATGVEYRAVPKSWGPNFLQFGISLEDDFEGSTGFNLATRMTRAGLNKLGAEMRLDLQLGTDPTVIAEFYQPLSFDSRYFIAPRVEFRQYNLNAFDMDETIARYRVSSGELNLDIGRELGTIGEFRVGAYRGYADARVTVGSELLPNQSIETGGLFARLRMDSQDAPRFARHGMLADITWNLSRPNLGADFKSETITGEVSQTWSRGKSSLQFGLSYATTLNDFGNIQEFFPLGGFLRLSGLERGALNGPHAGLARLVYYRRIGDTAGGVFETPVYLGISAEAGNVWQQRSDMSFSSMQMNGSVFAGLDTYFGPLFLAAGFAENGGSNFYLFIGEPPR